MKNPAPRLLALLAATTLVVLTGCTTVDEGPVAPTNPNAKPIIQGTEPAPAPIPQKNVPEGESSLSHKNPDQRIDQPKG